MTYSDGVTSCSTTVVVDVAPPVVVPTIVPNPLNPCPAATDLTAEVNFNSCNYSIYLYDNGGNGWITVPQTPTSIDNRIDVLINGASIGTYTLNNGHGPDIYNIPISSGDQLEVNFMTGGPSPPAFEMLYFVVDNQGNLITNGAGNIISAMGLTTSPSSPFWPVPSGILPSNGFSVVPTNFGPITVSCPTTNPYTYTWEVASNGSTAGIGNPNSQNTTVTTATTQDYLVTVN